MKSLLCCLSLLVGSVPALAQSSAAEDPVRIKPLEVVTELPQTAWNTLKFSFQRDSVPVWAGLIASTAALYQYDEDTWKWASAQGRRWNIGNEDHTKTVLELGPYPLVRLPSDTGSALYFLGDGWTHFGISLGFTGYGYFSGDTRPWNTGLEIFHGMMVSTLFNQALKRTTGHETPSQHTERRGRWRSFPDTPTYSRNTAKYDAFPTGHLMTATLMFTTVRLNYPEYSAYIWPVQILWSAALGFQMVNNGVHWMSDYPLGIAMGWAVAKMTYRLGERNNKTQANARAGQAQDWMFFPGVAPTGETTMNAMLSF